MPFVFFGVTTNTSISALFLSGVVPGLRSRRAGDRLVAHHAHLRRQPDARQRRQRPRLKALWALVMPIIIIGGMKSGIFTPTEAAVVAAFYALVLRCSSTER